MVVNFNYKGSNFKYRLNGIGSKTIVLLHGYLESSGVWSRFSKELEKKYKVIIPDLPGHGESDTLRYNNSIDDMADFVKHILIDQNIGKCTLIGHSFGGYIALAFLENYSEYLDGLSLFHSSPYSDSNEKKIDREREITVIKNGKKAQVYNNHFPKTFANENVERFSDEIENCKNRAKNMSDEGIINALNAMKNRKDRSEVLKKTNIPVQYIIGKKDNFIPMEILEKLELPKSSVINILENSGHMGFIEEKANSLIIITDFIEKFEI